MGETSNGQQNAAAHLGIEPVNGALSFSLITDGPHWVSGH